VVVGGEAGGVGSSDMGRVSETLCTGDAAWGSCLMCPAPKQVWVDIVYVEF
jgi:hypothetical protein